MGQLVRNIQGIMMSMSTLVVLLTISSLCNSCNKAFYDAGGKTFTCPDSGSSTSCDLDKCEITCSDGKEYKKECDSGEFASVSTTTNPDGSTVMHVLCSEEKPKIELCFPFCNSVKTPFNV